MATTTVDEKIKQLLKKTKAELVAMCQKQMLNPKGHKHDLAMRLVHTCHPSDPFQDVITVRKNDSGQYCHEETGFIFDPMTKRVVGKVSTDGTIEKLSRKDIDSCKDHKFLYKLPETIDDDRDDIYEIIEDGASNDSDPIDDDDDEDFQDESESDD